MTLLIYLLNNQNLCQLMSVNFLIWFNMDFFFNRAAPNSVFLSDFKNLYFKQSRHGFSTLPSFFFQEM